MREIFAENIAAAAQKLYIRGATMLAPDLAMALECACDAEYEFAARIALAGMIKNFKETAFKRLTLRRADEFIVFCELGRDTRITGGTLREAIIEGVFRARKSGLLRAGEPISEEVAAAPEIYLRERSGDELSMTMAFGSCESDILSFPETADIEEIEDFVVSAAERVSERIVPPLVIGAGIGDTEDAAKKLAKYALYRPVDTENADPFYARTERRIKNKINTLKIGADRLGGKSTALAVNIEAGSESFAPSFCALNISDHRVLRASCVL